MCKMLLTVMLQKVSAAVSPVTLSIGALANVLLGILAVRGKAELFSHLINVQTHPFVA